VNRHFQIDRRTLAKYKTDLPVHAIPFPATVKKNCSNSWGKRPGGSELVHRCKGFWKDHLVTSPKKDDLVFKHVRGDGNHFLTELNGLKQLVCSPGKSFLVLTQQ